MQLTCKYIWENKRVKLDLDVGWLEIAESEKEHAIDVVLEGLDPTLQEDWGDAVRSVVHWRLYQLHRLARMKVQRARDGPAGETRMHLSQSHGGVRAEKSFSGEEEGTQ